MKKQTQHLRNPDNFTSTIIATTRLSKRYFMLELTRPERFPDSAPGNFVHVLVPGRDRFFLRRPFSIFDCTTERISLLILERGEGTRRLRAASPGSAIEFLGPLGNGFPAPAGKRVIAIAGGVGLAPLYYLAKTVTDGSVTLIYGSRTKEELFLGSIDLAANGALLATDDGSHGFHGTAVALAEQTIAERGGDAVFSCGPHGMLAGAARLAERLGIPHHVSLENRMACGFGVCRSCVIQTAGANGPVNRTVCHDGPVFDASVVLWNVLPDPAVGAGG